MRTLILATAALLCGTSAMAQTTVTTTDASGTTQGATTKVIALGDHVTVQRAMPDGTVMVRTLTGKEADEARRGDPAQLAFNATTGTMTTGAGGTVVASATDPAVPNVSGDLATALVVAPAVATPPAPMTTQKTVVSGSTRTTTTVQVMPKVAPAPAPMTTGAGEAQPVGERG